MPKALFRSSFIPLVFIAFAFVTATPSLAEQALVMRERHAGVMGTDLHIEVYGTDAKTLDEAIDSAIAEMRRIEDLMTDWRESELTRLNDSAGTGPHKVSEELAQIISRAVALHKLTKGAFDITYAGVGHLWDFKATPPRIPTADAIERGLGFVDASRVRVLTADSMVELPHNMRIGLGGIAKGYGIDRAVSVLMSKGIKNGTVNAGGDMKLLGGKNGRPWEIAIKHPRDRERAMAVLNLANSCVVTSGDYERFFEKDGQRYHHIIDPRTGYPSEGCLSATVVAQNAEYADALATAMCVMGPGKGLRLINSLPRVEAILVGMDGEVHVSPGLEDTIQ